ncbi:PGAP1-like protein-domain-containing protein [Plectosphaerella plurivora]|uniref:GPI inositol-deacylase n=1 Tax=Plectosphaerella plurivora TaxID=936078 RepID=A0A9P9A934_9PEZI|nr:PGAP1-like protein-domain-containing protein [Plectosphaerella plurivora]
MSYMRPSYIHLKEFDTEHTRFATKYSLHLYREQGIDDGRRLRGVPVLFIPGNAGSYRQVRPIAAEAARFHHDQLDKSKSASSTPNLDFFTVDFNEDITAFHGQTLLDQAEYLNEAIRYIIALYLDPRMSSREAHLPDPTSVLILGHSMGGVVARTMLSMPNYQADSINTIITMSAPHARAPVTFDNQIVDTYGDINDYWRKSFSQKWANNNPLWHVTLISIAGGGLDTVVPSDYASVESIVPETHGFTVFTTGIPNVWTSMDHQAILWCDQFRKVVTRALYDVIDVRRASQTRPRAERMRIFRKWFLTGLEKKDDRMLSSRASTTLLTIQDNADGIAAPGERLVLRHVGQAGKPVAHLLPIPPQGSPKGDHFTLLTDIAVDNVGEHGKLEVLLCSAVVAEPVDSSLFDLDLRQSTSGKHSRLTCKSASSDFVALPASTSESKHPFDLRAATGGQQMSFLEYDMEDLTDLQFIAIIDKSLEPSKGFVLAEFSGSADLSRVILDSPRNLLTSNSTTKLPSDRPLTTTLHFPNLRSSLLAYKVTIKKGKCDRQEIFAPLLRQYLVQPYESKFFVNVGTADVSLHGVTPFVPPPMSYKPFDEQGLSLQLWSDPTCRSEAEVRLDIDIPGSFGKLSMRFRTVFAAFPLLVVTLVLRKQFKVYDSTGSYISFSDSLDLCLRHSLPLMLLSLTLLSLSLRGSDSSALGIMWDAWNLDPPALDLHNNDLLTGTQDPFFWCLIPLIGAICVGVCAVLHYAVVVLTYIMSLLYGWTVSCLSASKASGRPRLLPPAFSPSPPRRRAIVIAILLVLVTTCIPYQFAYLVACLCQLLTTMRALWITNEVRTPASRNFYNYSHSLLLLMLWVLPINMPTLVVWLRNLLVQWFTPFSSHHNVLSIMPFLLLVENLSTGNMIPRTRGRLGHLTSVLLFGTAVYAAMYGVSYAYMLHHLVNIIAVWLVALHSTANQWSLGGAGSLLGIGNDAQLKRSKAP